MKPTIIIGAVLGVLVFALALMFSYTVDQQERGVLLRNGALVGIAEWTIPHYRLEHGHWEYR